MSQHNDILKHEISGGLQDGLPVHRIIQRIQAILDIQEWDQATVDAVPGDALNVATWMMTQKDGLYGASHDQLHAFTKQLTKEYGLNPRGFN